MPDGIRRRRRPSARASATAVAACLAGTVVAGFFGGASPVLDALAQFRAHASVALVLAAVALLAVRRAGAGLGALAVAALGIYSALPFMVAGGPAGAAPPGLPRYTLLQMNLRHDETDKASAVGLIARLRPDVVTAQEVTRAWATVFAKLRDAYPYQSYCTEAFRIGSTLILSRRPFVETGPDRSAAASFCDESNGFSLRTVDFNGLPVAVGAQHLRWPWPFRQGPMVEALRPMLETLGDPLLIAGDFNSVPWAASVGRYAAASRTRVLAGIGPTWIARFLPPGLARLGGFPLDNVLVSEGIDVLGVETTAPTASDHLPVLVTFTLRFALPEEPDVQSAER